MSVIEITSRQTRATIRDVARVCGLSITTVSQAINLPPSQSRVAGETRHRVLRAAEELGYRPSARARSLAKGRSHSVGLLYTQTVPWLTGLYTNLLRSLADALQRRGYRLEFVPLLGDPGEWRHLLADQKLDGCVVMSHVPGPLEQTLASGVLPVVMVNAESALSAPHIQPDDHAGAVLLMRHLLDLGHRRITFFHDRTRHQPHLSVEQREAGYAEMMTEAGLGDRVRIVVDDVRAMSDALADGRDDSTALIAYDDFQALKLVGSLAGRGVAVPGRVSVATFNDMEQLQYLHPPVTTVAMPVNDMAEAAVEQLIGMIERPGDPSPPARSVLPMTLIPRESTATPAG